PGTRGCGSPHCASARPSRRGARRGGWLRKERSDPSLVPILAQAEEERLDVAEVEPRRAREELHDLLHDERQRAHPLQPVERLLVRRCVEPRLALGGEDLVLHAVEQNRLARAEHTSDHRHEVRVGDEVIRRRLGDAHPAQHVPLLELAEEHRDGALREPELLLDLRGRVRLVPEVEERPDPAVVRLEAPVLDDGTDCFEDALLPVAERRRTDRPTALDQRDLTHGDASAAGDGAVWKLIWRSRDQRSMSSPPGRSAYGPSAESASSISWLTVRRAASSAPPRSMRAASTRQVSSGAPWAQNATRSCARAGSSSHARASTYDGFPFFRSWSGSLPL